MKLRTLFLSTLVVACGPEKAPVTTTDAGPSTSEPGVMAFDAGPATFDAGLTAADAGRTEHDAGTPPQRDAGVILDAGVVGSKVKLHIQIIGTGSVSSVSAGVSCSADCDASLDQGLNVVLTALASTNATFTGWSGGCLGTAACALTLTAETTVTATFATAGTSYFVGPTGNNSAAGTLLQPFKTIAKALSVVAPGDIIEVRAGTYNENLIIGNAGTVTKRLTLRGYNGERPVIRGSGPGPTIYFYNNACDESTIGDGTGNTDCLSMYWVIDGIEVRGSASGGSDGNAIKIDTAKVRLQNNHLCCTVADVVKLVRTANDVEIFNNEIWQDAAITQPSDNAQGIDIVGADRTHIDGNWVHDVPDIGMYAKGNARQTLIENNVLVNIGVGANGHGIMLGQNTDANLLLDGPYESYDGIVRNNVVINASWACVATSSSSNVRISNNSCFNTGTTTHGSIFLSNESEIGTKSVTIEVVNNIIFGSASHPLIKITADALADATTLTIDHNLYFVAGGAPSFQPNAEQSAVSFTSWLSQYHLLTGKVDSSRVLDPRFATTTGSTPLTLQASSPAIDTGVTTSLVPTDARGIARPTGAGTDIGAYEY